MEYLLEDYYNWEIVESRRKYLIAVRRQIDFQSRHDVLFIVTHQYVVHFLPFSA